MTGAKNRPPVSLAKPRGKQEDRERPNNEKGAGRIPKKEMY